MPIQEKHLPMRRILQGVLVLLAMSCTPEKQVIYSPMRVHILDGYALRNPTGEIRPSLLRYYTDESFYSAFTPISKDGVLPSRPNFTHEAVYGILVPGEGRYGPITLDSMVLKGTALNVHAHAWPMAYPNKKDPPHTLLWFLFTDRFGISQISLFLNERYETTITTAVRDWSSITSSSGSSRRS
jgi:hypothetical protein